MCSSGSVPPPPGFTLEERNLMDEQALTLEQFRDLLSNEQVEANSSRNLFKNLSGIYKTVQDADTTKEVYNDDKALEHLNKILPQVGGKGKDARNRDRQAWMDAVRGHKDDTEWLKSRDVPLGTEAVKGKERSVIDEDAVTRLRSKIDQNIGYDDKIRTDATKFLDEQLNKPKTETEVRQERISDLQTRIAENTLRKEAGLPPVAIPQELYGGTGTTPTDETGTPAVPETAQDLPAGWTPEMAAQQLNLDQQQLDIAGEMAARQKKALAGELPVSEATRMSKEKDFAALKAQLARAGHEITGDTADTAQGTSTPAVQALDAFRKRYSLLEDQERRGELSSGAGINLAQSGYIEDLLRGRQAAAQGTIDARLNRNLSMAGYLSNQGQQQFSNAYTLRNMPSTGTPGQLGYLGMSDQYSGAQFLPALSQLSGMYGQMAAPYQQQRLLGYQSQLQGAANRNATFNSLIGGAFGLGGAGLMAMSSKKFKKNIEPVDPKEEERILDDLKGRRTYRYDYKHEQTGSRRQHIGMLAEEAPDRVRRGDFIDIPNHLGVLTSAIRALSRRVETMSAKGA